jgi:hypothetical protein
VIDPENAGVDPELERVLRMLDEAAEWAKTYRFEMTEEYLALIDRVEAMPQNQSGADKSGRWRGSMAYAKALRALATLVPRVK